MPDLYPFPAPGTKGLRGLGPASGQRREPRREPVTQARRLRVVKGHVLGIEDPEGRGHMLQRRLFDLAAVRRPLGFRHRCLAHCQTLVCHPVGRVAFLMGLSRNSST